MSRGPHFAEWDEGCQIEWQYGDNYLEVSFTDDGVYVLQMKGMDSVIDELMEPSKVYGLIKSFIDENAGKEDHPLKKGGAMADYDAEHSPGDNNCACVDCCQLQSDNVDSPHIIAKEGESK